MPCKKHNKINEVCAAPLPQLSGRANNQAHTSTHTRTHRHTLTHTGTQQELSNQAQAMATYDALMSFPSPHVFTYSYVIIIILAHSGTPTHAHTRTHTHTTRYPARFVEHFASRSRSQSRTKNVLYWHFLHNCRPFSPLLFLLSPPFSAK